MNLPIIKGVFARRILANFRADAEIVAAQLPAPFRPKLHRGKAIVGVCLIRLEGARPQFSPLSFGLSSENAAHRVAVEWGEADQTRQGVFVPRRDTNSRISHWSGGRIFPGEQHLAQFQVSETENSVDIRMDSCDGQVHVHVVGEVSDEFPTDSVFSSLDEASAFFESGCLGYSARCNSDKLDGMRLETPIWRVQALDVSQISSSVFDDTKQFPIDSVSFDHALLMRDIEHQWHAAKLLSAS